MKYNYHTLYCFLTAVFLCHFVQAQEIVATENLRLCDPFITVDRDNACYYLVHSRWKDGRGGLFALRSQDLEHWEKTGFVYNAPEDYLGTDDWWAPDTYPYNGNWYTFVTVRNESQGILRGTTVLHSTDGPLGSYSPVLPSEQPLFATDGGHQMVFRDLKGRLRIAFHIPNGPSGSERVAIRKIKIRNGRFVSFQKH